MNWQAIRLTEEKRTGRKDDLMIWWHSKKSPKVAKECQKMANIAKVPKDSQKVVQSWQKKQKVYESG